MTNGRIRTISHPDDHPALRVFLNERHGESGLVTLSESKLIGLADQLTGFVYESDSAVNGLVAINPASTAGEWAIEVVAQPDPSVIAGLVKAAEAHVVRNGGTHIRWWMYDHGWDTEAVRQGFEPERELLVMNRALPLGREPRFPPSVEIRPFVVGRDEEKWLEVNNAAFSGHPENGDWGVDDLAKRFQAPWFSAAGFRMAWEGDELVGFCWTKIHHDGDGEIYVIAASPRQWGRGLGKELVVEGLRYLAEMNCPSVFLYTEGDNERAISLYGDLGFTVAKTHRAFLKALS